MKRYHEYPKSDTVLELQDMGTANRHALIHEVAYNRQRGLMVVMEDVHNPHNLAAITRTCDVFGIQTITFTLENHDLFNPKMVGKIASSAANKWVDYRIFEAGTQDCFDTLHQEGWHIVATVAGESSPAVYDVDFTAPPYNQQLAVVVGNEHAGISPRAQALADSTVTIPMFGMTKSLNVSVAAAVIVAEITRQRRAATDPERFLLSDEDAAQLERDLLLRRRTH